MPNHGTTGATGRALVLIAMAAFLGLAVGAHTHPYLAVDLAATRTVQTLPSSLGLVLIAVSWLGYAPQSYAIAGATALGLAIAGLRREAALTLFAGGVVAAGNLVKLLVRRPRPDPELVQVMRALAPWGFPSGHVVAFTAFAGFLVFLVWTRAGSRAVRVTVLVSFAIADALMGLSRMYVGDHWLTDVIGGYLLGGLWLALTIALFHRFGRPERHAGVALLALALALVAPRAGHAQSPAGADSSVALPSAGPTDTTATVARPPRSGGRGAAPDTAGLDDLRATTAPPWNPARPVPRRRAWEQVIQFPERLVTLPLTGLGLLTERALYHGEESGRIPLAPRFTERARSRSTFSAGTPGLGDFAGLGLSLEARTSVGPGRLATAFDVRAAQSHHKYDQLRLGVIGRPLALQFVHTWRPQDRFYGVGDDAALSATTSFATSTQAVRGSLRAEWLERPNGRPRRSIELWAGPREVTTSRGREPDRASFEQFFPAFTPILDRTIDHFVTGARVAFDERRGEPHWARGGRVTLSAERFDDPVRALAFQDARPQGARFTRYTAEAEAGTSFHRDPRTLRLLLRVVHQDVQARPDRFLISDLSTLGGQPGLEGYVPGRFHDRDLALARLTYVFPVSRRVEMAPYYDLGGVYHDVFHDLQSRTLRHTVGIFLRARSLTNPVAEIGVDISPEQVRLGYGIGGLE